MIISLLVNNSKTAKAIVFGTMKSWLYNKHKPNIPAMSLLLYPSQLNYTADRLSSCFIY